MGCCWVFLDHVISKPAVTCAPIPSDAESQQVTVSQDIHKTKKRKAVPPSVLYLPNRSSKFEHACHQLKGILE